MVARCSEVYTEPTGLRLLCLVLRLLSQFCSLKTEYYITTKYPINLPRVRVTSNEKSF